MNKWEVDEHKQWSKKVRSHRFVHPCWTKTETMKGSDQIKENRSSLGMNGSNFRNEMLFVSFTVHPINTSFLAERI